MATTTITATAIPDAGYNLTDSADFDTLSTGAGNGVEFTYAPHLEVYLKNGTGGSGVFTFKVKQPAEFAAKGGTIPDVDVTVADTKTWRYKLSSIFKQGSNGTVIIECDVAGEVLVLNPQQ